MHNAALCVAEKSPSYNEDPYIARRILPLSSSFAARLGETITRSRFALHQRGLTPSAKRVRSTSSCPHAGAGCIIPQGGRPSSGAKMELWARAASRCPGSSAQLADPARRSPASVGCPHVYVEPFAKGKAEPVGE